MSATGLEPLMFPLPFEGPQLPGKDVVGSKAHNLMRMARAGLEVPPGFVISTALSRAFVERGQACIEPLDDALRQELARLERLTGRRLGDFRRPFLLSVRSGAAVSMPGMMETVLNVGLSRTAMGGLVRLTGNPRLAQDCRRRLVQQFGEVVDGIPAARFAGRVDEALRSAEVGEVGELSTDELAALVAGLEEVYEAETERRFPEDPARQLHSAVEAVLRSWSSERAKSYRALAGIPETLGTAVTVQVMAFGNIGPDSGSGVGFTRNPADGADTIYVDFLGNAQGEDVVAGRHRASGLEELARRAPSAHDALLAAKSLLEREFRDMQDFEFTVENGRLLMLQARAGKRTPLAALRIARDLVAQGIVTRAQALATLGDLDLDSIEVTGLRIPPGMQPIATGVPAGIGVVAGAAVFDPDRIASLKPRMTRLVLVRPSAETSDLAALAGVDGLVTMEGARTSHAAVVARQLGKACIVACAGLSIDSSGRHARFGSETISEGEAISIDAATGRVFKGQLEIVRERPVALIEEIRGWATASEPAAPPRKRRKPVAGRAASLNGGHG